jgi:uncharacterized membrane protein/cbb3-type cytochrome oxidase subunit 3
MSKKIDYKTFVPLGKIFVPIILGLGVVGTIWILLGDTIRSKYLTLVSAYFFPPLGKETIIPTGVALGINPLVMALSIAFVDIIVALFLIWNYDLAKKIPIVGKFMIKVENIGKNSSEKYSWIIPLRFIGIVLFVMIPFQGSGGMVGSIVGRFIGMKPWNTFLAITTGSIIGCVTIAFFADAILSIFSKNIIQGILIVIIILIIGIIIFVYKKTSKNKKNDTSRKI